MDIRILLVDDHGFVRDSLRALIRTQEAMEVVGEAHNGRQAIQMARELRPDVIVMDINMPVMDGIKATGHIAAENPEANILILSLRCDSSFVEAAMHAGAKAYLDKERATRELIDTICALAPGRTDPPTEP